MLARVFSSLYVKVLTQCSRFNVRRLYFELFVFVVCLVVRLERLVGCGPTGHRDTSGSYVLRPAQGGGDCTFMPIIARVFWKTTTHMGDLFG